MCGIIGEHGFDSSNDSFLKRRDLLAHRGPDSFGAVDLYDGKLKFGHRRLAIIDLSDKGGQPLNIDGYVIIYNGEVYNFEDIKFKLGLETISHCDTEVILRGYIKNGVDFFATLDGMFALAIYDPKRQVVVLARDRLGVKPLYYYLDGPKFSFASEIQALNVPFVINYEAVESFLQQGFVYSDEEIIKKVKSLPAGSVAVFDLNDNTFKQKIYYYPKFDIKFSDQNVAEEKFYSIIKESVKSSLISDVPVGVFLSAGNDSSLITALAKEVVGNVRTFTIGFDSTSFDESIRAEKIANILGTDHHTLKLNKREILDEIPKILDAFNMPFADSSALPFYFLSRYARKYVKVCLSGDGADEFFGGYPLYYLPPLVNIYKKLPFKNQFKKILSQIPTSFSKMSFDYKVKRFMRGAEFDYSLAHFNYRAMDYQKILKDDHFLEKDGFEALFDEVRQENIKNQLMYVDQKTVLQKDYLIKVDSMSMAHGLEVRVPFLNNEVTNFSQQLDPNLKIKNITTKYLLKKTLERYLPKELIYGKKEGFSFPIASWLCEELKDFMLETLSFDNIAKIGFLDYDEVQLMIRDHLTRRKDYNRELWGLISLVRFLSRNNFNQ